MSASGEAAKPATLEQCHLVIDELSAQLTVLQQAVALLTEKLAMDSRNSSKPPSSDGPGRGNRRQCRASERRRGAQKGHPGAWREALPESELDSVHDCVPPAVCECGGAVNVRGKPERHQVLDLPPAIKPVVAEYRLYGGVCAGCGRVHDGVLPAWGAARTDRSARAGAGGRAGHAVPDAADEDP